MSGPDAACVSPSEFNAAISMLPPLGMLEIFKTGIAEIDADHQELIDRCNALTTMVAGRASWRALHAAAHHLAQRCLQHFQREEAILARSGFPRCDAHIREHQRFGSRFRELADRFAQENAPPDEHLTTIDRLRDVLVDLLLRHDLDYKSYLDHAMGR